jgi:hypothetical protein
MCFDITFSDKNRQLCIKFRDLNAKNDSLSGFVDLIAEKEAVKAKFGYFRLAANQVFINEIKHIEYEAGEFKQMKAKELFEW